MSKPVIPERYKLQHSGFVGMLTNGSEDGNGFVELLVIKLMSELGAAEAKVAELVAANEFAKTKYSAYRDEATAEYARYELMLAEQAATIERLTGITQAARKHKLLILHDAECFSIDGSKPCVCGREELRAILDAGDMHASSAITMMAINERLTKALCMLYDKYEDGPPCTEDGDEFGSPLGNCVQLTADEEDEILALIPASRDAAFSKQEPK